MLIALICLRVGILEIPALVLHLHMNYSFLLTVEIVLFFVLFFLFEFSYKLDIDKFVFIATIELNRPVWPILSKHEAVTLILKYSTLITSTQAGLSKMSCVFVHLKIVFSSFFH